MFFFFKKKTRPKLRPIEGVESPNTVQHNSVFSPIGGQHWISSFHQRSRPLLDLAFKIESDCAFQKLPDQRSMTRGSTQLCAHACACARASVCVCVVCVCALCYLCVFGVCSLCVLCVLCVCSVCAQCVFCVCCISALRKQSKDTDEAYCKPAATTGQEL